MSIINISNKPCQFQSTDYWVDDTLETSSLPSEVWIPRRQSTIRGMDQW